MPISLCPSSPNISLWYINVSAYVERGEVRPVLIEGLVVELDELFCGRSQDVMQGANSPEQIRLPSGKNRGETYEQRC